MDVITTAQVFLRFRNDSFLTKDQINHAEDDTSPPLLKDSKKLPLKHYTRNQYPGYIGMELLILLVLS